MPTEVYPKKHLYGLEEWMGLGEKSMKERERFSLKPEDMTSFSDLAAKAEGPNPDVIKMKEKMLD